ncbi:MAG TPA: hypothetical protein VHO91_15090 [Rhodopila sp.]|nr:hypothetical protein [Rhodopila sp.]
MHTATSASSAWAESNFLPRRRGTPRVVVIAGIDRSDIVDAALADPALTDTIVPHLEPACAPPFDALLWRCETATGDALNRPGLLARIWHRAPYAVTVRLVCYKPGDTAPEILDEATIGTRGPRDAFRSALDRIAMRFIRDAALERGRGPSAAAPAMPSGRGGWLDYQRARWQDRLCTEWWSLGESTAPVDAVLGGAGLGTVQWRNVAATDRYLADPFPWPGTGRILCEEMPTRGGTGRIVAIGPRTQPPQVILDDGPHHSYPCTLQEQDIVFCVPESTGRGETCIYKLLDNGTLKPVVVPAPHLRLADPTLFQHEGRYWLACTDLDVGTHDNLCLLHAPSIEGPWVPHRLWPAKIDIRSARPAGMVFTHQGRLFRPAQDCAATYGAAVTINEIRRLTEADFEETPVTVLRPEKSGPFPHGLHTLVHDGTRFWVDGKRFVFDPARTGQRFIAKVSRRFAGAGG